MQKLSRYFFSDYHLKNRSLWFKRSIYIFLIVESIYQLCFYDLLFGQHSIVTITPKFIGFFKSIAFLLYNSGSESLSIYFLAVIIGLSALNLFTSSFRFPADLILWIAVINIHNRIYPSLTGGDNLMNQFLFFNCFLSGNFVIKTTWQTELKICLHNLAVLALIIQVCLVYFLSALAKVNDPEWLEGTAVMSISQIKHFSLFSFLNSFRGITPAFVFLNYVVLFYQLLFPLLIWIKKIKKPLLWLGILMHLYIAFVMGLVAFGFVMILAYLFFWPEEKAVS